MCVIFTGGREADKIRVFQWICVWSAEKQFDQLDQRTAIGFSNCKLKEMSFRILSLAKSWQPKKNASFLLTF